MNGLAKQFGVSKYERGRYVLAKADDYKILAKCKLLESVKIGKGDNHVVKLIKTQLKRNWRRPLLKELSRLLKKHKQR